VAAHSIRNNKQPAVRLRARSGGWLDVSQVVFVMRSGSARVGELRELELEQF